jgi:enamine deaminase RidA (YjgF/YER057c/UK114 family)
MGRIEERLLELGLELPAPKQPVANYLGTVAAGDQLFVSARVSERRGALGTDLSTEEGYTAARETILSLLSIVRSDVPLERIASVVKLVGFIRSGPLFTEQPRVLDGASDLLVELFGPSGRHARTATGVAQLPFGAAVQIEMILGLAPG